MARRSELQGICNDLLDSFISRCNDLGGYWALGKFQLFLKRKAVQELQFHLSTVPDPKTKAPYLLTSEYYRQAFQRHLKIRKIPHSWVQECYIKVKQKSESELMCRMYVTSDLGKEYVADRCVLVRPHNIYLENRRSDRYGPTNSKGF